MARSVVRLGVLALAFVGALAPAPSRAIAPALLFMVRQIAQQVATSMIQDALLSGLSGMGCKGMALTNALQAFDLRSAGGGVGALLGGMPKLPAGMALPGLPAGMNLPSTSDAAGLAMGGLGGLPQAAGLPAGVAAKMGAMMPNAGQVQLNEDADPGQAAMIARAMQAMAHPLSPAETLATIDDLAELGFLPKPIQAEFKECMVLVPGSAQALGMGMGMLKPMVPQLRQARAELHALSPTEQDEVAATLIEEMKPLPADQRAALIEYLDTGFFPPRVVAGVKAGLAGR